MRSFATLVSRTALAALALVSTALAANPYDGLPSAARIQDLTTTADFDAALLKAGRGVPTLVVHFHGQCASCQARAPAVATAAERASNAQDADLVLRDVVWARVDGKANADLMRRYGIAGNGPVSEGGLLSKASAGAIPGYPVLVFTSSSAKPLVVPLDDDSADAGSTADALLKFVRDELRKASPAQASKALLAGIGGGKSLALNADTFHPIVMAEERDVFVKFYAPWCGHCKKLAPRYAKVAAVFKENPSCLVTTFNSDPPAERAIARHQQIRGFPTLKFYPAKGNTRTNATKAEPEIYRGQRSPQALLDFLNARCGTNARLPTAREEWEGWFAAWKARTFGGSKDGRGQEL